MHDACSATATNAAAASTSLHVRQTDSCVSKVLLATAKVNIRSPHDDLIAVRALIDPGSEVSLVTEALTQRLRLPRSPAATIILGIGGRRSGRARGRVELTINSRVTDAVITVSALVIPRIAAHAAPDGAAYPRWPHLEGLPLADPDLQTAGAVEILLGADAYASIVEDGLRRGGPGTPIGQKTTLGWLVSGVANYSKGGASVKSLQCSIDDELPALVRRFWEQEELEHPPLPLTEEEQRCEDLFASTHSRLPSGRYMVRLPFRTTPPTDLSKTRDIALRVLHSVERRGRNNPGLLEKYSNFMKEYEELGHMSQVPEQNSDHAMPRCYLPHHGVFKGTGEDAKIRVVFNGSAKLPSGESLNSHLLTGPNLLPPLPDILSQWRFHRYVMIADMEKMYRQILVHPADRDMQRIVWRRPNDGAIIDLRLNTVTYGQGPAPYLAIRSTRQLAADERPAYPRAAAALEEETYVDDVLSGADTREGARELAGELTSLCSAGGFPLRKWASNCDKVLTDISPEHRQQELHSWEPNQGHATLGLQWRPGEDAFAFKVQPSEIGRTTKRAVLSQTARLFDPLGWLAPVIVRAKILFQSTWLQRLEWDQPLPAADEQEWRQLFNEMPAVSCLRIPRWIHTQRKDCTIELHGFADASERAYAAVLYLKASIDGGRSTITLLSAKTKIAPIQRVSIPRLELNAAVLLAKKAARAQKTLKLAGIKIKLWTDSTVTLAWIRGHPTRWTTFVANRVAEIQRELPDAIWSHVASRDNPADCASRGLSPRELVGHTLWWQGPPWLHEDVSHAVEVLEDSDIPEQRARVHVGACAEPTEPELLLRFSTLSRLMRVTAWCRRWLRALRPAKLNAESTLTTQELEEAQWAWIRVTQAVWHAEEIRILSRQEQLPKRSQLLRLSPFLDEDHILRVGGRLKHAVLSHDERHPAILPRDSRLTTLVIKALHERTLHGGVQLTLAMIRQKFWIPRGRALVRQCIHRCIPCVRWRAASPSPLMGSLPSPRVTMTRAFAHTGVDYAGPILIRTSRGRGHKAYKGFIALFVCLCTRAVHLEAVSDLTTEAFLAALRRFTARRGRCTAIYSDRGTNFVGADKELRSFLRAATTEDPLWRDSLTNEGIAWRFNPPAAPHMGGLWEAAVKSVKHHLRRVIGESTLTFEELATLLAQVEACLNSRPLQAMSDDPEDLTALTPGHLLIGAALTAIPEPALTTTTNVSRWQHLQKMRDHFWQRWSTEYLQTLHARPKWQTQQDAAKVGDLCLIRNELTPPNRWPLARITAIHPGDDQQVRVVTARTANTTITRPVAKIVLLPCEDQN